MNKLAVAVIVIVIMVTPAMALDIEGGTGVTLFPVRGADFGPFLSIGVWNIPDNWGTFGNETLFADFGQLDGNATLGGSISISGVSDTRMRIGATILQEHGAGNQIYVRYGIPIGSW